MGKLRNALTRDLRNVLAYGANAPRYAERIWVDPFECALCCELPNGRARTATVSDWTTEVSFHPVSDQPKIRFCLAHWIDGVPWEDTGIYEHMGELLATYGAIDECRTMDDIVRRYRRLDEIFGQVRAEGRLRTVREIHPNRFREDGGILIHLGPNRTLVFGLGGYHRFAMALACGFRSIPAQIGCVHPSWIGGLPRLRQPHVTMAKPPAMSAEISV